MHLKRPVTVFHSQATPHRLRALIVFTVLCLGGLLTGIPSAGAHGGDITIDVNTSVSGSTVTFQIHLTWADGHNVTGQGVQVTATGPSTRSTLLPATNSSGQTSGTMVLSDGTWTLTLVTDGGERTLGLTVGTPTPTQPVTTVPVVTTGAPTTTVSITPSTRPTSTTRSTTTVVSTTHTPTEPTQVIAPDPSPTSSTTVGSGSSTTSSTRSNIPSIKAVGDSTPHGDRDEGTFGWWLVGVATAATASVLVVRARRRRRLQTET